MPGFRVVAVAEVDQILRDELTVGKEFRVEQIAIEPGHRPCVQAECAGGDQDVRHLQQPVVPRHRPTRELRLRRLRDHTRAHVTHLFRAEEMLGPRLVSYETFARSSEAGPN